MRIIYACPTKRKKMLKNFFRQSNKVSTRHRRLPIQPPHDLTLRKIHEEKAKKKTSMWKKVMSM